MINIPKGTKDVLPFESYKWKYIENKIREVAALFCLKEIRTPTFENTELFLRGVGGTTDIVNKEMYTFSMKGDKSLTLKPEGTAGVARSFIENNLGDVLPRKMYYITPVFRHERPQAGRFREHHQFGVEFYGVQDAAADAEVIKIAKFLLNSVGINNLTLNINSIGCKKCRADYNKALKEYYRKNYDLLCATCKERFEKNPLRLLDCKEESCIPLKKNAPKVLDYLCEECSEHFENLKANLDYAEIKYTVNPGIVRGLDYYTKTVFEFISEEIGAKGTVCGGGRYDNLVEEIGGKPMPACGFGMGIERLLMVVESNGTIIPDDDKPDVYVAYIGDKCKKEAFKIVDYLRFNNIKTETEYMGRSIKAQFKNAARSNSSYVIVFGEDELAENCCKIKNMADSTEEKVGIDNILNYLKEKIDIKEVR